MLHLKKSLIRWILFYLFIAVILLNNSLSYLDPDLGWHFQAGKEISESGQVPRVEHYNYTIEGKTWIDHEWFLNYFSYYIYNNLGYTWLNVFFALIVLATLIILTIFTKKRYLKENSSDFFIMFFQFFAVWGMKPHLGIRMQEITLLLLLLLLIILENYNRNKKIKVLFWLIPLFCFWANVHAGFLIGIFIMFFWLGIKILELLLQKFSIAKFINLENILTTKELAKFFFFSVLGTLSTLLTPYGFTLYSFLFEYSNSFYMKVISEWTPIFSLPIQYVQIFYIASVISFLIIYFYDSTKKKNLKLNLWDLSLIVLFVILSCKSKRHFPLFFIVSFPFFIKTIEQTLEITPNIISFFKNNRIIKFYFIVCLLLVTASFLAKTNIIKDPFSWPKFCQEYPCQAIDFLKNSEYKDLKIFNDYGWGGYLIWVWPEKKLFIDGKMPQTSFAEHTILEEYLDFFKQDKVQEKLNTYNIELALLKINKTIKLNWFEKYILNMDEQALNNQRNYLKEYFNSSEEWSLVYSDQLSQIYAKK